MTVPAVRIVPLTQEPQPHELRHLVLRSGNEDLVGALIVASFATEREALDEAEHLLSRFPEFHYWHVVVVHEMERTTVITSRRTGPES